MNPKTRNVIIFLIVVLVLAILQPFFVISEGQQVVITRLGRIVNVHTEAGLKIKIPFVDQATFYSRKLLSSDGIPQKVQTSERQYIWLDTTARWRIADPEVFYKRLTTLEDAYSQLDTVIESQFRTIISRYKMAESVRSSNRILEIAPDLATFQESGTAGSEGSVNSDSRLDNLFSTAYEPVELGREALSREVLSRARAAMPEFGIELQDVIIRQIRYSDELTETVYERMISERRKIAAGHRATGNGIKAEWQGRLNRDSDILLSAARREADEIRAEGDAEAAAIYAEAYRASPEFYNFWKAMESYKSTLPGQRKIFSTDMEFFDYLHQIR